MDPSIVARCVQHVVLVRIRGPDYTRTKVLGRPFFQADAGITTLSASGVLLDPVRGIVITTATLLSPFMQHPLPRDIPIDQCLKKGTELHILTEFEHYSFAADAIVERNRENKQKTPGHFTEILPKQPTLQHDEELRWHHAQLLTLIKCKGVDSVMKHLTGVTFDQNSDNASSPSTQNWEVGWQRSESQIQGTAHPIEQLSRAYWQGYDDIAVLSCRLPVDQTSSNSHDRSDSLTFANCNMLKKGEPVMMIGSPFGIINPSIFTNCTFQATISNLLTEPNESGRVVMLMLDQLCLPGCEGGAVFDRFGALVGIIAPPIRKADASLVEVNLIITVNTFVSEMRKVIDKQTQLNPLPQPQLRAFPSEELSIDSEIPNFLSIKNVNASNVYATEVIRRVQKSVVLISVGAYWASGVLVSRSGHIITCAHLFKPLLSSNDRPLKLQIAEEITQQYENEEEMSLAPQLQPGYTIDVRLDLLEDGEKGTITSRWLVADLQFVSFSHIDVAIVKVRNFDSFRRLLPTASLKDIMSITEDGTFSEPTQGQLVYVLGHGLFGPSKKLLPMSINGVISRVVYMHGKPQIIETSARIHRGVSGGLLTNTKGEFVGLVTSNARQKDGRIIPNINFSIPAVCLAPIHHFLTHNEDKSYLKILTRKDPTGATLWKLKLTQSDDFKTAQKQTQSSFFTFLNRLEHYGNTDNEMKDVTIAKILTSKL